MDIFDEIISKGKFKEMAIEEMERQEKEAKEKDQPNPRQSLMDRAKKIREKVDAEAASGQPRRTAEGGNPMRSGNYKRRTGSPGNYKYYYKSEADMKNNLFKSEPSPLIESGSFEIRVGGGADYSQPLRKGLEGNARDRLEQTLWKAQHAPVKMDAAMKNAIKGEDTGLKNTHGENWHSDNDKMAEAHTSNVDVIDRDHEVDKEDRKRMPKRKDSLVDASLKSLTQEELFLKSFKKEEIKKEPESIERSLDSLINMIPDQQDPDVIRNIHENDDSIRSKKREPELVMRSDDAVGRKISKLKDEGKPQKQAVAIALDMERRGDIGKSELDEMVDIIKGRCWDGYKPVKGKKPYSDGSCAKKGDMDFDDDGEMDEHERHHAKMEKLAQVEEKEHAKKAKKSFGRFVKSAGPGGIIMNFGASTGNPIADNFSRHLNAFAEPVQEQTALDQAAAYERSLTDYVEKGEQKFMQSQHGSTNGGMNDGWAKQMNTSMDQQVKEAFEKGELGKGEENPLLRSVQKSQQASFPQQAQPTGQQVQSVVAGQQLSAQSETDAQVMEMYNSMMKSQEVQAGEFVADTKGQSIIAGDPLPPELEQYKVAE
jgi:hypothetical protein